MTDLNWFFSSLSQSTAAILGLFGAFIFTKIINNEQNFNENKDKVIDYITYSHEIKRQISIISFRYYNEFKRKKGIAKIISYDFSEEDKKNLSEPIFLFYKFTFSPFDDKEIIIKEIRETIKNTDQNNSQFNEILDIITKQPNDSSLKMDSYFDVKKFGSYEIEYGNKDYLNYISIAERIDEIMPEIYNNTKKTLNFWNKIRNNPESSTLVTSSILISIILMFFCLSLPLLVMPAGEEINIQLFLNQFSTNLSSLKGLFVLTLTFLVTVIFVVFLIKNLKMKYSKEDLKKLENYTLFGSYSEYLKNYVNNTKFNKDD